MPRVDVELPAEASSAAAARALVRSSVLDVSALDAQVLDRILLLTSEIVTNAILHARTGLRLTVHIEDGLAQVRVYDGVSLLPRRQSYRADAGTGRGLHLVEALADAWGIDQTSEGKCVWFSIALSPSRQPAPRGDLV